METKKYIRSSKAKLVVPLFWVCAVFAIGGCYLDVLTPCWWECDSWGCFEVCEGDYWEYCDYSGCYSCSGDFCERNDNLCAGSDVGLPCGTCKSNSGNCTPPTSCEASTDCEFGYVCNTGKCVLDEKLPNLCQSADTCETGFCVDAKCGSCTGDCGQSKTCQFDRHCGEGRFCLDGQCANKCSTNTDCGSGQICKGQVCVTNTQTQCIANADCASGICVNNACYPLCLGKRECTNSADICVSDIKVEEQGVNVCMADYLAKPECVIGKDCANGEQCVNGVCRTPCANNTDCVACDNSPVCAKGGFCMSETEVNAICVNNKDCTDGKLCLSGQCVSL
ncbi:MAG: hypothetical protein V1754_05260 [Pseudomonadota bacterium]